MIIIKRFCIAVLCSCGGNLLMNVGPTADGRIIPAFQHSRNDCCRWENGCLSMVRLFTAQSPGELRMIPLTKTCGEFRIFYYSKDRSIWALRLSIEKRAICLGVPEGWYKRRNLHRALKTSNLFLARESAGQLQTLSVNTSRKPEACAKLSARK